MAAASKRVAGTRSLSARRDAADPLQVYCPDLDQWPSSWAYEPCDLTPGRQMVACFTPFLRSLLDAHLSPRTLRRHRDNLWLLGGEVIRRLQMDSGLRRQPIAQVVRSLIGGDGGPLLSHGQSEAEQTGFDATCRKLGRFLAPRHSSRDPAPGPSPATTDRAIDGMYADPSAGRVAVKPQSRAAVRRRRRA